jgi:hypothetical protein
MTVTTRIDRLCLFHSQDLSLWNGKVKSKEPMLQKVRSSLSQSALPDGIAMQ